MKKLLVSAMIVLACMLFHTPSASAQNPNTIKLDFDSPVSSNIRSGCPIKVWVGYVDPNTHIASPGGGWTVTFILWSGPGPVPVLGVTGNNGLLKRTLAQKTEVKARVSDSSQNVHLLSLPLKCTPIVSDK